jgi:hypothetical protein
VIGGGCLDRIAPSPGPSADVAAVLDDLSDKKTELAKELHYDGDTSNSASMKIWLHKQIMVILAANGGKLPNDLYNRANRAISDFAHSRGLAATGRRCPA